MTINKAINFFMGSVILLALTLAHVNGQANLLQMSWLWLAAFVGFQLVQREITGFCPAAMVFKALGLKNT
jgi:Protein of unknown function (DUF2892)